MDDKQTVQGKHLKKIDLNADSFTANGKEYLIETNSLSFDRLNYYHFSQIEAAYEPGFYKTHENIGKAIELLNKMKFVDAAVLLHNTHNGIKTIVDRRMPVIEMCALFINTKDEDRRYINEAQIKAKIKDWEEEGLDMLPFFQLGINSLKGFSSAFEKISQNISELKKEAENIKSSLSETSNQNSEATGQE